MRITLTALFLSSAIATAGYDESNDEISCKTLEGANIIAKVSKSTPTTLHIHPLGNYKKPLPYTGEIEEMWKDNRVYVRQFVNYSDRIAIRIKEEAEMRPASDGGRLLKGRGVLQGYDFVSIDIECIYHEDFH